MSAKKSFDIDHKRHAGKKTVRHTRTTAAKKKARTTARTRKIQTLRERRREERGRRSLFASACILVVIGLCVYGLWQPEVRIQEVDASLMADPKGVMHLVQQKLEGHIYMILPRDSFFFYPAQEIRNTILQVYPRINALEIVRNGFTTLSISSEDRGLAFVWCGEPENIEETCYEADETGFIYALAGEMSTTSMTLRVRGFIDSASSTDAYPLRARVIGHESIPDILLFVHSLESFGTLIPSVTIRGDEIDLYTEHGTRVTYVLGQEKQALKDADAALKAVNLADGSIEYIDLRFDGRVYLKRNQ